MAELTPEAGAQKVSVRHQSLSFPMGRNHHEPLLTVILIYNRGF